MKSKTDEIKQYIKRMLLFINFNSIIIFVGIVITLIYFVIQKYDLVFSPVEFVNILFKSLSQFVLGYLIYHEITSSREKRINERQFKSAIKTFEKLISKLQKYINVKGKRKPDVVKEFRSLTHLLTFSIENIQKISKSIGHNEQTIEILQKINQSCEQLEKLKVIAGNEKLIKTETDRIIENLKSIKILGVYYEN